MVYEEDNLTPFSSEDEVEKEDPAKEDPEEDPDIEEGGEEIE